MQLSIVKDEGNAGKLSNSFVPHIICVIVDGRAGSDVKKFPEQYNSVNPTGNVGKLVNWLFSQLKDASETGKAGSESSAF